MSSNHKLWVQIFEFKKHKVNDNSGKPPDELIGVWIYLSNEAYRIWVLKLFLVFLSKFLTLCKMCPISELFWSAFGSNARKYRPELLRIGPLFTQCYSSKTGFISSLWTKKIVFIFTEVWTFYCLKISGS